MANSDSGHFYQLERRTLQFAKDMRAFVACVPKVLLSVDLLRQVLRSSSSIGANYLEANESLGKKDFLMRVRIARKEAKETQYWLELLSEFPALDTDRQKLKKEAHELELILGSIIRKSQ